MSNSKLVNVKVPAYEGNYTKGRNKAIRCITIHHMAGVLSAEQCGKIFQAVGRNGSSHYGIGNDGKIAQYVDEENTAWTNSNFASNSESVTIETSNSAIGGLWPVGEAAFNSLITLVADIAQRNNLGKLVPGDNLTWHRMFTSTSCPGEYLLSKMNEIADRVNRLNFPADYESPAGAGIDAFTDVQLADKVIRGEYGNGEDRKKALGDRYNAVQAIVNERLMPNPEAAAKPVVAEDEDLTGKTVVPIKLVDVNGTHLVQYDKEYIVSNDYGKEVVLQARNTTWARMLKENVRVV